MMPKVDTSSSESPALTGRYAPKHAPTGYSVAANPDGAWVRPKAQKLRARSSGGSESREDKLEGCIAVYEY